MSTRKFAVGDRVVFVCPGNPCSGEESVITDILVAAYTCKAACGGGWIAGETIYELADLETEDGLDAAAPARYLRPLYDGRETVSWEQCAWQPRALKV